MQQRRTHALRCLNLFNNVVIIALVPLFDGVVYPALRRAKAEPGPLGKIGAGMALEVPTHTRLER